MSRGRAALLATALASCGSGDQGPTSSLAMQVRVPDSLAHAITSLELRVLDDAALCDPPDATGGRTLLTTELEPGVPGTVRVSAGVRTFSVVAHDGATSVARGCDRQELEPGATHAITISLVEYSTQPDGGLADGGMADGGMPDGGVDPPDHDTCEAPDVLVEGEPATRSTEDAVDDYELDCLPAGGGDVVHQLALESSRAVLVRIDPLAPDWDVVAALRLAEDCEAGPDLSCVTERFSTLFINRPNLAAGEYALVIDGAGGASGDYTVVYETRPADTSFGYWIIDAAGTYASIAGQPEAVQRTIPLSAPDSTNCDAGDEWSVSLSLPFAFPYYDTSYDTVHANANMFVTFDTPPTGPAAWVNDCPLDASSPSNMIAPFWADGMSIDGASELWTREEGEAPNRRFVIEYRDWEIIHVDGACHRLDVAVNHQLILYESGDIEMRYGPRQPPSSQRGCGEQHLGCTSTIGIEGETTPGDPLTTQVHQVQCNSASSPIEEGRVLYFVYPR